jgi:hypothetical protein
MNHNEPNTIAPATDPLSIHQRAIAIDMHADTVQRVLDEDVDIEQQLSDGFARSPSNIRKRGYWQLRPPTFVVPRVREKSRR